MNLYQTKKELEKLISFCETKIKEHGLTNDQFDFLFFLSEHKMAYCKQIWENFDWSPSKVTLMANYLSGKRYIKRRRGLNNRKQIEMFLTKKGERVLNKILEEKVHNTKVTVDVSKFGDVSILSKPGFITVVIKDHYFCPGDENRPEIEYDDEGEPYVEKAIN